MPREVDTAPHLTELERNDIEGALAFYRSHKAAGTLEDWQVRVLCKLQDDPTELLARIRGVPRLIDLERNNVPQALEYFERSVRAGTLKDTDTRTLYLLQDDPDELVRELGKLIEQLKAEGMTLD